MVLIITYDLRTPKDYHDLFETIKAQADGGKWWHYMTSTWLLSTTKTPQQVVEAIQPHLDNQDSLFVCELSPNYQGRLPKAAWDWINSELATPLLNLKVLEGLYGSPPVPPGVPPVLGVLPPVSQLKTIADLFGELPPPPKKGTIADLIGELPPPPPKKPGER